jgi:hypothetical protein
MTQLTTLGNAWWTRWQLISGDFIFWGEDKTGVKLSTLFFMGLLFFGVTLQVSVCAKTNTLANCNLGNNENRPVIEKTSSYQPS